jgi:hypothetical protein
VLSVRVVAPEPPQLEPLGWWREFAQLSHISGVDLALLGSSEATYQAITEFLRPRCDVLIWSGHGLRNRLVTADGRFVDGEDLATYARPATPRVIVVAACYSAAADEDLDSITLAISQAGLNAIGMHAAVGDAAAVVFNVEFVRALAAGADLGRAFRLAQKRMAEVDLACAQNAFLMPALTNGYRVIADHVAQLDTRVGGVEQKIDQILLRIENLDRRRR